MLIVTKRRMVIYYPPTPEEKVWSGVERLPPGWLPAGIGGGTIRWIRVGSQYPTVPFFERWVAALRSSVATPRENETDLSSLAQSVAHLSEVEPAGSPTKGFNDFRQFPGSPQNGCSRFCRYGL